MTRDLRIERVMVDMLIARELPSPMYGSSPYLESDLAIYYDRAAQIVDYCIARTRES